MASQEEIVCVFTDGSCLDNGKSNAKGSSALCWPNGEFQDKAYFLPDESIRTNNRMEFFAALKAMELMNEYDLSKTKILKIFTDSNLLIQTFEKWMDNWQVRGWTKSSPGEIKNLDLVKRLYEFKQSHRIEFVHVRAHTGRKDYNSIWNDKVDKLAQSIVHLDHVFKIEDGSSGKRNNDNKDNKPMSSKKRKTNFWS